MSQSRAGDPRRSDAVFRGLVGCPPMRRLARHLFTLCSAVSLVLCVAVLIALLAVRAGFGRGIAVTVGDPLFCVMPHTDGVNVLYARRWPSGSEPWKPMPDSHGKSPSLAFTLGPR